MHSHTALPATPVAHNATLVKWTLRRSKSRTSVEACVPSRRRSLTGACLLQGDEVEARGPTCCNRVHFRIATRPHALLPTAAASSFPAARGGL